MSDREEFRLSDLKLTIGDLLRPVEVIKAMALVASFQSNESQVARVNDLCDRLFAILETYVDFHHWITYRLHGFRKNINVEGDFFRMLEDGISETEKLIRNEDGTAFWEAPGETVGKEPEPAVDESPVAAGDPVADKQKREECFLRCAQVIADCQTREELNAISVTIKNCIDAGSLDKTQRDVLAANWEAKKNILAEMRGAK